MGFCVMLKYPPCSKINRELLCTTKEQRLEIYGKHPLKGDKIKKTEPWKQPIFHQMDSMVMKFPLSWAFGKFVACVVPEHRKEFESTRRSKEFDDIYHGVCFLTIGNILVNVEERRAGIIKDIKHCDWLPSPLPRRGESAIQWHLRLVNIIKGWEEKHANKEHKYISIEPLTIVALDEIRINWDSFDENGGDCIYPLLEDRIDLELRLFHAPQLSALHKFLFHANK